MLKIRKGAALRSERDALCATGEETGMNVQIFGLLGIIGASPYMAGATRLNSQYSSIETLLEKKAYVGCVAACNAMFDQLMTCLYLAVTGDKEKLSVILSDIEFWKVIDDKNFCDTAGMLHYACYRLTEEDGGEQEPEKAAELARTGLDSIIEHMAHFLSKYGERKCLDPLVLKRDDVRAAVRRLIESLQRKLEGAGCEDGLSMQPPYMNAALAGFPEEEAALWAGYIALRLRRAGLLASDRLHTLDADWVVTERVGLTTEFIRRAAAEANGGVLLIEHMEEFDMPCVGGNLIDRALRTILTAAETYVGSMCIVLAGQGKNVAKAFRTTLKGNERFPMLLILKEKEEK